MKTVVVTGGTKGIGAEISKKFLFEGWNVLVSAREKSGLANEKHKYLKFESMDVKYEKDHYNVIKKALKWTGKLDCYINCAGFSKWKPLSQINDEFWNSMMETNLKGAFWGCKVASSNLSKGGVIINVSSLAGKRGSTNNSVYCASKFGMNGLTQALAKELGPKGIRVNAVCPVYVETPGLMEALNEKNAPSKGLPSAKYLDEFASSNAALQRIPLGTEVADLCFYLASPLSSALTGQCINIDCGVFPQ